MKERKKLVQGKTLCQFGHLFISEDQTVDPYAIEEEEEEDEGNNVNSHRAILNKQIMSIDLIQF